MKNTTPIWTCLLRKIENQRLNKKQNTGVGRKIGFLALSLLLTAQFLFGFTGTALAGVPGSPTLAQPKGIFLTASGFTLNWTASAGATGYLVDITANNDYIPDLPRYAKRDAGNVTGLKVRGLSPGTTYYCRVFAFNGEGISTESNRISVTTLSAGDISTVAGGNGRSDNGDGDGGLATGAKMNGGGGLTFDSAGNMYFTEWTRLRKVTADTGSISSIANVRYDNVTYYNNNLYVSDHSAFKIWKMDTAGGNITVVAGSGTNGYTADGALAAGSAIEYTGPPVFDAAGNMYFAEVGNNIVRKVNAADKTLVTVAGDHTLGAGYSGDDGAATAAQLYHPYGLALDNSGTNLYIVDQGNHRIRRVNLSTGIITTAVGTGSTTYNGNGLGTATAIAFPLFLTFDAAGNLYFSEDGNNSVRRMDTGGNITAVAGTPQSSTYEADETPATAPGGDNTTATTVTLRAPRGLAFDSEGSLYFGDYNHDAIRRVLAAAPSAPTASDASSISANQFTANWTAVNGAAGYRLDLAADANFTVFVAGYRDKEVGSATSLTLSDLSAGTTYYYRVRAENASGISVFSNTKTVSTSSGSVAGGTIFSDSFSGSCSPQWQIVNENGIFYSFTENPGVLRNMIVPNTNLWQTDNTAKNIFVLPLPAGLDNYTVTTKIAFPTTPSEEWQMGLIGLLAKTGSVPDLDNMYRFGYGETDGGLYFQDVVETAAVATKTNSPNTPLCGSIWLRVTRSSNGQIAALYSTDGSTFNAFHTTSTSWTPAYVGLMTSAGGVSGDIPCDFDDFVLETVPSVPTAGAATDISTSGFTANWNAASGATSYRLDVATDSGFGAGTFATGYQDATVNGTTCAVTGLSAGTTYYYQIRAVNAGGTSSNSDTITAITVPSAPTANAASSISNTGFTVSWGSVTGAASYRLDVATDSGFGAGTYVTGYQDLTVNGTTSAVTGLTAGTTYHYRVRAVNAGGTSGNSGTQSAATVVNAPATPTATAATLVGTSGFTANWNASAGAASYRLDVSTDSVFGAGTFVTGYEDLTVNGTTSAITGLSAGTTYYYRVRAVNAGGTSSSSDPMTAATLPNAPGAPTATAATLVSTSGFTANWNASAGAASYRLDVATDFGFGAGTFVTGCEDLTVNGITSAITGLSAGTTYYYRVRAVNAGGTSSSSDPITAVTVPVAPTANTAANITDTGFTASWGSVTGATGYRLDLATDNGFSAMVTGYSNLSVAGTTYAVCALSPGTAYHYRVRAVNAGGISENSNAIDMATTSIHAALSDLETSQGTLSPAFNPTVTAYTVMVPNTTSSISLTPTLSVPNLTSVTVNGTTVQSGSTSSNIELVQGANQILVVFHPSSGSDVTYTANVFRAEPPGSDWTITRCEKVDIAGGTLTLPILELDMNDVSVLANGDKVTVNLPAGLTIQANGKPDYTKVAYHIGSDVYAVPAGGTGKVYLGTNVSDWVYGGIRIQTDALYDETTPNQLLQTAGQAPKWCAYATGASSFELAVLPNIEGTAGPGRLRILLTNVLAGETTAGDLTAVVTTSAGSAFPSGNYTFGQSVNPGTTSSVHSVYSVPAGVSSAVDMVMIQENIRNTLSPGEEIRFTLPEGITWADGTLSTISVQNLWAFSGATSTVGLSGDKRVLTVTVPTPTTSTIEGRITLGNLAIMVPDNYMGSRSILLNVSSSLGNVTETNLPLASIVGVTGTRIAAGANHTLVINAAGAVQAFGDNTCGQCDVPADASSDVVAVQAGGNLSMALKSDGSLVMWGQ